MKLIELMRALFCHAFVINVKQDDWVDFEEASVQYCSLMFNTPKLTKIWYFTLHITPCENYMKLLKPVRDL